MAAKTIRKVKRELKIDAEQAYTETVKLLYKLAWHTHKTYHVPFDECLSECHYAFVKTLNWRFDPTKGTKFSTQVHNIAHWRLRSLVRDRTLARPMMELNEEVVGIPAPPMHSPCLEAVEGLSDDAQEIIALLLETPAELMQEVMTPKQLLASVRDYLLARGKRREDFNQATAEIRLCFQEVWA